MRELVSGWHTCFIDQLGGDSLVEHVEKTVLRQVRNDGVDAAMEKVASLGRRQVGLQMRQALDVPYRVFTAADPDGNEFCLGTAEERAYVRGS